MPIQPVISQCFYVCIHMSLILKRSLYRVFSAYCNVPQSLNCPTGLRMRPDYLFLHPENENQDRFELVNKIPTFFTALAGYFVPPQNILAFLHSSTYQCSRWPRRWAGRWLPSSLRVTPWTAASRTWPCDCCWAQTQCWRPIRKGRRPAWFGCCQDSKAPAFYL